LRDPERERVLGLLKRHGHAPTSFQVLEPGLSYWFCGDACVAYADVHGAWVTAGEPICAPDQRAQVAQAFVRAAQGHGRRARFFHVSESFVHVTGLGSTQIGEQPHWDPSIWEGTLASARSLREQLRRARAKGVRVRSVTAREMGDRESAVRKGCEALIQRWLASRGMSPMKFMVLLHPFEFPEERRFVVAEREGAIVGLASAIPVYARGGFFVEDLLRDPKAPNGTAELLVDAMFRFLAEEGCHYATLGLAPLSGEVNRVLAATRDYTARLYNFAGVRAFKEKLRPISWEPVHLAYPAHEYGVLALRDVLAAFAPGGLVRFALNSLVHQRTLATALLAGLLVPWTLGLALMDTARWFPSLTVQYAWVAFDVLLIALMLSLVRKWRARVATWVVALTTLDALLTTLQVLAWNVWTARSAFDWTLVLLACTGPLLAAAFFWTTRLVAVGERFRLRGGERPDA
jgi:phosphatidylglycerol lysyltransferase